MVRAKSSRGHAGYPSGEIFSNRLRDVAVRQCPELRGLVGQDSCQAEGVLKRTCGSICQARRRNGGVQLACRPRFLNGWPRWRAHLYRAHPPFIPRNTTSDIWPGPAFQGNVSSRRPCIAPQGLEILRLGEYGTKTALPAGCTQHSLSVGGRTCTGTGTSSSPETVELARNPNPCHPPALCMWWSSMQSHS